MTATDFSSMRLPVLEPSVAPGERAQPPFSDAAHPNSTKENILMGAQRQLPADERQGEMGPERKNPQIAWALRGSSGGIAARSSSIVVLPVFRGWSKPGQSHLQVHDQPRLHLVHHKGHGGVQTGCDEHAVTHPVPAPRTSASGL